MNIRTEDKYCSVICAEILISFQMNFFCKKYVQNGHYCNIGVLFFSLDTQNKGLIFKFDISYIKKRQLIHSYLNHQLLLKLSLLFKALSEFSF